jgi:hypothetical protein
LKLLFEIIITNLDKIKDIVTLIISIITVIFIGLGLSAWRTQLKGQNKFQLAFDTIKELRLLQDKIIRCRSPMVPGEEIYDALIKNHVEVKDQNNENGHKYAMFERMKEMVEQFNIYEDKMLRLQILLNNYELDLVNEKRIRNYVLDLKHNRMMFDLENRTELHPVRREEINYDEERKKIIKILYSGYNPDVFGNDISNYINTINNRLRKYIK